MSEYRRFVSYIYAYRDGKKDQNVGFAKVEIREGKLKINIQLGGLKNEPEGLDVYGFVRNGEKLYGIVLGEMKNGIQPVFRLEDDPENIRESGHALKELSGLWIKGNHGENYITIWDDDPVESMELEVEVHMEEDTAEVETGVEVHVEEDAAEVEVHIEEDIAKEKVHMEENTAGTELAAAEVVEVDEGTAAAEAEISAETEVSETTVSAEVEAADGSEMENIVLESIGISGITPVKPLNGVRAQESLSMAASDSVLSSAADIDTSNSAAADERFDRVVSETGFGSTMSGQGEVSGGMWAGCPHVMPFSEGEVEDCVRITPRELALFRKREWNAQKNHFILHGYYQFRHLLFGKFANGTYFLGVPGYFNVQERQRAAAFGFPVFKEAKEQRRNGRFGYWCRPVE